jgi:hypothetical protein
MIQKPAGRIAAQAGTCKADSAEARAVEKTVVTRRRDGSSANPIRQ